MEVVFHPVVDHLGVHAYFIVAPRDVSFLQVLNVLCLSPLVPNEMASVLLF